MGTIQSKSVMHQPGVQNDGSKHVTSRSSHATAGALLTPSSPGVVPSTNLWSSLSALVSSSILPSPSPSAPARGVPLQPGRSAFSTMLQTAQCDAAAPPPPPLPAPSAPPQPPPAPGNAPPPPPSTATAGDDSIAAAARSVSSYSNPGPYDQASMDGKRLVSLDSFDGFRCDINKQVSPFMGVVHSFWLGTTMIPDGRKSTYTFLTQVADDSHLFMTRVDPSRGSVDGRIHVVGLGGLFIGKVQMEVSSSGQSDQVLAELDVNGQTWSGNLKYGSMGGGIVYGCNYLQSITPKLCMGGDGMYIGANGNLLGSYTLRYSIPARTGEEDSPIRPISTSVNRAPGMPPMDTGGSSTLCINYNQAQVLTMNYRRVVTPNRVQLGAELQCNPFTLDSQVLVGAEFKLQRSKVSLCLDGTGRIQSLLEAKLGQGGPGSPTLTFSADVNHFTEEMRFGYGINIDG